jgi:hypothetical protein
VGFGWVMGMSEGVVSLDGFAWVVLVWLPGAGGAMCVVVLSWFGFGWLVVFFGWWIFSLKAGVNLSFMMLS